MITPTPVFTEDENGNPTTTQFACIAPASNDDAQRLLAMDQSTGNTRSEFFWMRLHDGTLLLGVYPQGDTYMEFSDGGVCDWQWAERQQQVSTTRLDEARQHMIDYLVESTMQSSAADIEWYVREYYEKLDPVDLAQEFRDTGGEDA